ncbi:MAG: sugar ABC transporter permease [Anaerolineae bacterium]|nr:sugar ABC transporter permease [Anaerolineae bacterium]
MDGGMVNHLLGLVGIAPVPWLTGQPIPLINALPVIGPWLVSNLNANYGFLTIVLIDVWQWTPFVTLVLVSGLYALPVEVLESALVDGAGYWQTVRRIVLPLLKPAILVVVLLRAMDALKVFETVWSLFGNAAAYRLINVHIVTLTLRIRNYGQGAAISVVVLIIVLILSRYLTRAFLGRELRT